MSIAKTTSSRIVYPLSLIARNRVKEIEYTNTLSLCSSLSEKDLQNVMFRRKEELLEYAISNVPWYRERKPSLPEVKVMASDYSAWQEIPIVDRNSIGPEESKFVSDCSLDTLWSDTSGSTGRKFRYLTDRNASLWSEAAIAYAYKQIGGSPGSRQMVVWGAPRDVNCQSRLLHRLRMRLLRQKTILAYKIDSERARAILSEIRHFKPTLLRSYPNILLDLSRHDRQGVLSTPDVIITAGEWLRPDLRRKLEEVTGKKVYDWYGSREFGSIAYECTAHNGLHIFSPLVFVEVLREDMTPCDPGERGEIVVTSLTRRSMPLIRYRTGDMGSLSKMKCSCGSAFPLFSELHGRTMDVIRLPNGESIAGYFWTHIARDITGIDQFRIVQSCSGSITVEVILEAGAPDETAEIFRSKVIQELNIPIEIDVVIVDKLPVNQSGKTGLVVSEYDPNG